MNQEKIMQKLVDAGMVNEVVSAETMMEQLIKEKSKIMQVGKSFVIYDPNGESWNILLPALEKKDIK